MCREGSNMAKEAAAEEERSRMLFSKLRQVVTKKFGYGVKENKIMGVLIYKMSGKELSRLVRNGAFYHIKRIYREFFTFRLDTVRVHVKEGELKGRKMVSVLGKTYYRFQGIPYAKPPVGPLRFKDPEPPEPWTGVRSALKEGSIASQSDVITGLVRGNEDCLFLNVFTPELPKENREPPSKSVLVWIHGGGFHLGSGNAEIYGPDFFLEDDVVLVTLNYRLGVFGFLCTGTEDAPGNAGLKDIVQALKWVKENISVFGGSPDKVTIFGESAGAAAVHYLMLSPLAEGLFSRAISQSGTALCPWAINDDPLGTAFRLGRAFGLDTTDPKALVDFLREIPPKVLAKKQTVALSEQSKRECIPFAFLPCVEPFSPTAFLSEHPIDLLQNQRLHNDVPYLTGVNKMEGMIMLKPIMDKYPPASDLDEDFERLVPRFLRFRYGSDDSKRAAEKIREFYFDNQPFDKRTFKEYVDLTTDTYFVWPMVETSLLQSRFATSPIYSYHFLYDGNLGLLKKILNIKDLTGPAHADDLGYLFHIPLLAPTVDPKTPDMRIRKKMVRLWTNFAKFGNPTPDPGEDPVLGSIKWDPFEEEQQKYLIIGDGLIVAERINQHRLQFWRDLKDGIRGSPKVVEAD